MSESRAARGGLSLDEVQRLFKAAAGDRLEALYELAVGTGLRQGELLGLPWGDLDCNGAMNPVDALKTLRFDAALSVSQEAECFEVGSLVTVTEL